MWTFADVRRRSLWGLVALALRGGAGKIANVASLLVLSRLLAPTDFGAFAILQLPASLASLLADAGISAALIQCPDSLTPAEEQTGFTLRLLFAVTLGGLLALIAGPVGQLYRLDVNTIWALRLLSIEPFISAAGTVPGVRLVRALRFDQLAWIEFVSLVNGQIVAIGLAWAGAGLWSLVFGALVTSAAGTVLVSILAPWRPQLGLQAKHCKLLLRFGLTYQGQGLAHLAKDKIVPALGGLILSGAQVGYLTWAQEIARWPRLPADYVARVGFPAFARLQNDPDGLGRLLQNALTLICTLGLVTVAIGISLGPLLVRWVFPQWEPAIPPLLILLMQTPLDALIAILLPLIYAIGHAGQGLRLSMIWTGLTWLFSLIMLFVWRNLNAIPLAFALATLCAAGLVARSIPRAIHIHWRSVIGKPLILALALGATLQVIVVMVR